MRVLLALFLPCLLFFTIGKPWSGIFCLILQLTILGWIPATIWAFFALSEYNQTRRFEHFGRRY
jgi:uncharacterized membrane protein YqaE (UPF0057 family)